MSTSRVGWRDVAELIKSFFFPGRFDKEMLALLAQGFAPDEAVRFLAALVGHYLVEGAGLAAALGSPVYVALESLSELTKYLEALAESITLDDDEGGAYRAFFRHAEAYEQFVCQIRPLLPELGRAMTSVLWAYITDNYSLRKDPNDLVLHAQRLAKDNLVEAKMAIASVGAMALRGRRVWWGWPDEIDEPLSQWMRTILAFVDSVTEEGEKPFESAMRQRERWAQESEYLAPLLQTLRDGTFSLARIQFSQRPERADARMDELLYELFDAKKRPSPELVAAFAAHGEVAIPHLIGVAQDARLWGRKAIGGGWAPIHAVDILGALEAPEAVEPLIQIMAATDSEDILYDHALMALEKIGTPALKPVLDVVRYSANKRLKLALTPVLGAVGRGSPQACDALISLYEGLGPRDDPGLVIMGLIEVGDRRAVPVLRGALRDRRLLPMDRVEIEEALEAMEVLV